MITSPTTLHLPDGQIRNFQETVWDYYRDFGRSMPWRDDPNPYYVLVSELMLQQTQVQRVIPKFLAFIDRFPTVDALSQAELGAVLEQWSGLGYNRRAKYLHEAAKMIASREHGVFPGTLETLIALPGVGRNTAGALLAYAFNQPVVYVETNIRTVFFHHFFQGKNDVSDRELLEIGRQVLDVSAPREWYWALMDYGAHLKKTANGYLDQSRHYKKQAPLKGSLREMRGRIIKALTTGNLDETELRLKVEADERFEVALRALEKEGLIHRHGSRYGLTPVSDSR